MSRGDDSGGCLKSRLESAAKSKRTTVRAGASCVPGVGAPNEKIDNVGHHRGP